MSGEGSYLLFELSFSFLVGDVYCWCAVMPTLIFGSGNVDSFIMPGPNAGTNYVVNDCYLLIRRTIYRVPVGDGKSIKSWAVFSVSNPNSLANSSNSFSCSSAY